MTQRGWPLSSARALRTTPFVLGALASLTAFAAQGHRSPVEVVPAVDLDRYAGKWYEIARLPNRFQSDCVCCVTVVNECRTGEGKSKAVEGEAKVASRDGPSSKLKVRFAPRFLSFLGFVWGDYWILDLAEDYSHALVGSPDRNYLWVLARDRKMAEETYAEIQEKAAGMGFDTSRVQRTVQEE